MSVKISELPTQTAISGNDYLVGDNGTDTTYKFQVSVLESEVNAAIEQTASDAVASVNTAKTQAVSAVDTKGDEVLDSIPADYTTLSNDVTQLKNELNYVNTNVLSTIHNEKIIATKANTSILSTNHIFDVDITSGSKFTFEIIDNDENIDKYAVYANGSMLRGGCNPNTIYNFTASNNITYLSIYCTPSKAGYITAILELENKTISLETKVLNNTNAIAQVSDDISEANISIDGIKESLIPIQEIVGTDEQYKNSISHGSAVSYKTTETKVFAKQGWNVKVHLEDSANSGTTFLIYAKYAEDANPANIGRVVSGSVFEFTSQKTLEYVGAYITNLQSGTLELSIIVNSGNDIIAEIDSKVDKSGLGQVATDNLSDIDSNILFKQNNIVLTGTNAYVYNDIFTYSGQFKEGDTYSILCDSVTGASAPAPYAIILYNNQDTAIRQRQFADIEITASDINDGLAYVVFRLYPAKGTALPSGTATYINVRIVKGTEEEFNVTGNLKKAISTLFDEGFAEIPEYYFANNYLDNKANRISELAESCAGNGDVFLFITDEHWDFGYNQKHAPALIEYLANKCNIPRLFDGGDSANGTSIEFINAIHKAYNHDIHHIMGNHDWMLNRSGDYLAYYFDAYGYKQIGDAKKHYYYVDNNQKKIRYIILNAWKSDLSQSNTLVTAYDSEQLNWFVNDALNVNAGWDIIIFTHYIKCGSQIAPDGAINFLNAIDSYDGDGEIICIIEGHTHWDSISHTTKGIPIIATTCDKNKAWIDGEIDREPWLATNRPNGTIYEQAFDVFCLNRDTRTITAVRIGGLAMDNIDKTNIDDGFTGDGTLEERVINY